MHKLEKLILKKINFELNFIIAQKNTFRISAHFFSNNNKNKEKKEGISVINN